MPRRPLKLYLPGDLVKEFAKLPDAHDWWIGIFTPDLVPLPLVARFGVADDGRFVCTGLLIAPGKPYEITARQLHKVKLGELTAFVGAAATHGEHPFKRLVSGLGPEILTTFGVIADIAQPVKRFRLRPGPKGVPQALLEQVAKRYQSARRESPKRLVTRLADEFNLSPPTIRRYLRLCLDKGFLKPADKQPKASPKRQRPRLQVRPASAPRSGRRSA